MLNAVAKLFAATVAIILLSNPSLAAIRYWVVTDSGSDNCRIVTSEPDGIAVINVGKREFVSRSDAEKDLQELKKLTICK